MYGPEISERPVLSMGVAVVPENSVTGFKKIIKKKFFCRKFAKFTRRFENWPTLMSLRVIYC